MVREKHHRFGRLPVQLEKKTADEKESWLEHRIPLKKLMPRLFLRIQHPLFGLNGFARSFSLGVP